VTSGHILLWIRRTTFGMGRFEDTIRQEQIKQQTGSYARFTDIDGIGPATAEKIKNADYNIQAPKDVADMSADELADKAGISRSRAKNAIKGGGGNPAVSKREQTGSVSAAGIPLRQGDFMVSAGDIDKARARNDAMSRSEQAVREDDRQRAPVTTDYDRWKANMSGLDFPGVDTPTQDPYLQEKDVTQKPGNRPDTADFETRDQQDAEYRRESYPRKTSDALGNENAILETGEERLVAGQVAADIPDVTLPGFAPSDFENDEELPAYDQGSKTMGPEPSSQRLPEPLRQNLGTEAPQEALENQGREEEPVSFGEQLMQTREERGNIAANATYWQREVEQFEEQDMSPEFEEITPIAGQVVVELGDFFEGDEGGVDAVVTGLAERGAPVTGVEGTDRVRIDVSDQPRPIPYREREKSNTGRFAEEF